MEEMKNDQHVGVSEVTIIPKSLGDIMNDFDIINKNHPAKVGDVDLENKNNAPQIKDKEVNNGFKNKLKQQRDELTKKLNW